MPKQIQTAQICITIILFIIYVAKLNKKYIKLSVTFQ